MHGFSSGSNSPQQEQEPAHNAERLALEIHVKHTQERAVGPAEEGVSEQFNSSAMEQRKSDQFEVLFSLLMLLPV